jgi:hypothetical protein
VRKPRPGNTAPKGQKILVWGKPKNTKLISFYSEGWHTANWDEIDQAFCLTGGTWEGPFIKPKFWMPCPPAPADMTKKGKSK